MEGEELEPTQGPVQGWSRVGLWTVGRQQGRGGHCDRRAGAPGGDGALDLARAYFLIALLPPFLLKRQVQRSHLLVPAPKAPNHSELAEAKVWSPELIVGLP